MASEGLFLVVEGIEGAGKSSQATELAQWLGADGNAVLHTREPGGSPFAERIRGALLEPCDTPVAPLAELLAMFAARADHLANTIRPALARGDDVLCDRFTDASHAYQGKGRGLGADTVETLAELVHGDLQPDLVLLLDVSPEVGLGRSARRGGPADRIELESLDFFARVRDGYLSRAAAAPARYEVIDASADFVAVQQRMRLGVERARAARRTARPAGH